jgi:hypothetical protein
LLGTILGNAAEHQTLATMTGGRWPFSKQGKNDHETGSSSGERRRLQPSPPPPVRAPPPASRRSLSRPPLDRVYVQVKHAPHLYVRDQPMSWPDVNLPSRWHLHSRRAPVSPVPRDRSERYADIRRRRALLLMEMRRDPAFVIGSTN